MDPIKSGQYKDIILLIDEENIKCVDCGKENPTKTSVNQGIIICEECAKQHSQLGSNISFVRDLSDTFDEYLLNYFTLGGNSKFKRFLIQEKVDESLPIDKKYLTKACEFYRKNLKNKVKTDKLIEKNYENPNEIVENPENFFPEFETYDKDHQPKENKSKINQAKKVLGNLGSGLFNLGKKMYAGAKQGANFVANKAKPVTSEIKKGASLMGHKVGDVYSNIKNKIVTKIGKDKKKEGEEKKEEGQEEKKEEGKEEKKEEGKEENKEEVKEEKIDEKLDENNSEKVEKEEKKEEEIKKNNEGGIDLIGEVINQPVDNSQPQGGNEEKK